VIDVTVGQAAANKGEAAVLRIDLDPGQPLPRPGQRVRVILEPSDP
jgi:hypothetical protein